MFDSVLYWIIFLTAVSLAIASFIAQNRFIAMYREKIDANLPNNLSGFFRNDGRLETKFNAGAEEKRMAFFSPVQHKEVEKARILAIRLWIISSVFWIVFMVTNFV